MSSSTMHVCNTSQTFQIPNSTKCFYFYYHVRPSPLHLNSAFSASLSHSPVPCMEKIKLKLLIKDETFLQHPFVLTLVLVFGLVMMDPFHLGPVSEHEFRPVKHDIAPYHQVMKNWPRDNMSRLALYGKSEFNNEVFGPESLEFDNMGRGPYSGLADGRVVRWMGEELGWETFAVVTSNW